MHTQTAVRSERSQSLPRFRCAPPFGRCRAPALAKAVDADSLDQTIQLMGATMSYPRNSEIFGENEPAEYLYKVVSGSVRTYKILSDGRRQIGGSICPATFSGWNSPTSTRCRPRPSPTPRSWWSSAARSTRWPDRDAADRQAAVRADRPRTAARAGAHPAADQERAGARRELPPGNGGARLRAATPSICRCRARTSPIISA